MTPDAQSMQRLTQSQEWLDLSEQERAGVLQKFQGMSDAERKGMLKELTPLPAPPTPQPVTPPARRIMAVEGAPYAGEQLTNAGRTLGGIAANIGRQAFTSTPLGQIARSASELGLTPPAIDNMVWKPSPEELAATAVTAAVTGGAGALASKFLPAAALPYAMTAIDPLANYGARKLNVKLGLEQPGTAGDIASAALPLAVRGAGALTGFVANRTQTAQTLGQYDDANRARLTAMEQQALLETNAMRAQRAESSQRLQEWAGAMQNASTKAEQTNLARRQQYAQAIDDYNTRVTANAAAAERLGTVTAPAWEGSRAKAREQIRTAYNAVERAGDPAIPFDTVRKTAQEVMDEIAMKFTQFQDHPLYQAAKNFKEMGKTGGGATPAASGVLDAYGKPQPAPPATPVTYRDPTFSEVRPQLTGEGLGGMAYQYQQQGGNSSYLVQKLRHAVLDAMDKGGGETNAALRRANALARKDFALQDVEALFNPAVPGSGVHMTDRNMIEIEPKTIFNKLTELEGEASFRGAFQPGELDALKKQLEFLSGVDKIKSLPKAPRVATPTPVMAPNMPPEPQGSPPPMPVAEPSVPPSSLSMRNISIGAGVGSGLGYATGIGPGPGAAAGIGAGILAPEIGRILSQALLSPRGRPLLRKMLGSDLMIPPESLGLINAVLRGEATAPTDTRN